MSINLIETKETREGGHGYLFQINATNQILDYAGACLSRENVEEYIKNNPFPKDKEYSEEDFLNDLDSEGAISVFVEKEETAEYIAELFEELI